MFVGMSSWNSLMYLQSNAHTTHNKLKWCIEGQDEKRNGATLKFNTHALTLFIHLKVK